MPLRNTPIRRKLMLIILLTSGIVMLLMRGAFITYEYLTFRQIMTRQLAVLGEIMATNSTATLAFDNREDAQDILRALKAEKYLTGAAIYDRDGALFARYPETVSPAAFPQKPGKDGHRFEESQLTDFQPITQGNRRLGTLYLRFDTGTILGELMWSSLGIASGVMAIVLLIAFLLSRKLQQQISEPIVALAETAKAISLNNDYSVRAVKFGEDELGLLTDAFNQMIEQVQEQSRIRTQLAAIVESSDDAIISKNLEGIITSWNPGAAKIFGYTAKEAIGQSMLILFPPERATEEPALLARLRRGENIDHFETVRVRKDGVRVNISATISPLKDARGIVIGASKIARDITQRKREQVRLQFQAFFESLPGLYLILSPEFKIMAVSDAYLKATMTRREDITGRDLFEIFPDNPDDPAATGESNLRASLNRVLKNAATDTMAIQKYDVRRPDGIFEERFWSPVNSPVFGLDRQIEYIIHRVEDVTEFVRQKKVDAESGDLRIRLQRMEAEIFQSSQQVQSANQQLRTANAELESFSYSVSHDLRAPLRHIDGFAQLLGKHLDGKMDGTARRYLDTVTSSAKRLGLLIDELLVFSRMSRTGLQLRPVSMGKLIEEVVAELHPETQGRRIDWQVAPLPTLNADPVMLRQVWSNLIGNAVKYTRKREQATIAITCESGSESGHVFAIRDNGAGFDMQYANKLFGVFQRLHNDRDFEGTGIGLANVRRIVERHGGRVWAEAKPDEGATFYFSLPISVQEPTPLVPNLT